MAKYNGTRRSTSWPLKVLGLIVSAGVVLAVLEVAGITHVFHKEGPPTHFPVTTTTDGASANATKGPATTGTTASSTGTLAPPPASNAPKANAVNPGSSASLIAPSGNFVSNHNPGKNGSSQSENSVCNTTVGATCQIVFTNGSKTLSLPAETTDSNGSAYWNNWTPASVGLASGSWQVKAVGILDNQTKTTIDPMELVVQ